MMSNSGELPLVLAGPILRTVEETRACVWIATSQAARVKGLVFNTTATETTATEQLERYPVRLVRILPL
jgi:hypothetical protein